MYCMIWFSTLWLSQELLLTDLFTFFIYFLIMHHFSILLSMQSEAWALQSLPHDIALPAILASLIKFPNKDTPRSWMGNKAGSWLVFINNEDHGILSNCGISYLCNCIFSMLLMQPIQDSISAIMVFIILRYKTG